MIVTQTPLRIGFFGSGTDFHSFFRAEGGCVLTSAIDKYIVVTIKKRFDSKLRIEYDQTKMVDKVKEFRHELIREALRKTNIYQGENVRTKSDILSTDSGLGSSGSVTVSTLHALYTLRGETISAKRLVHEAIKIEIEILAEQKVNINRRLPVLRKLKQMAYTACEELRVDNIDAIGNLLHDR